MTINPFITALLGTLLVAGCGDNVDPVRYSSAPAALNSRVSVSYSTIALREVSLPAYATDEEISLADGSGAISQFPGSIWADDPTRAVTLRLTNALADVTRRTVAFDPWPFQDDPEVVIDVRLEDFIAETSGRFVARGRYYIANTDPDRKDRAGSFDLVQPFDPAQGFSAIAQAQSRIIAALAVEIASKGLR